MTITWKQLALFFVALVLGAWLLGGVIGKTSFFLGTLGRLSLALAVGVLVGYLILEYLKNRTNKESSSHKETSMEVNPVQELQDTLYGLANLNLEVRKASLPGDLLDRVEKLIDRLRVVIPLMYEEFVSFQLTWETKRIAVEYLPQICRRFAQLSSSQREERRSGFEEGLANIEAALSRIETMATQKNTQEFDSMADFLRMKFQPGISGTSL